MMVGGRGGKDEGVGGDVAVGEGVYFFLAGSPAFLLAVPRTYQRRNHQHRPFPSSPSPSRLFDVRRTRTFFCLFFLSFLFFLLAFSTLVANPDLTNRCLGSNRF